MKTILLTIMIILFFLTSCSKTILKDRNEINEIFTEYNKAEAPGCSVGIIKDGELIFLKGYGLADLENNIPVTPATVFNIGSISKQFTAACILILAEQNKLLLDDTLDKYFPDLPDYTKSITIRHLLNHTSGIRDYDGLAILKGLRYYNYYQDDEVMEWLKAQKSLNFLPGEEYMYSNTGYWLAGIIVSKVAGMNLAEFAQKEIFEPLGMTETHFNNEMSKLVKNRASGYYLEKPGDFRNMINPCEIIGSGGIYSTIGDIKKWDDAFYSNKFATEFWNKMTTRGVLNNGELTDYGFGFNIGIYKGLKVVSHKGLTGGGHQTILMRFPDQRFSVVIFSNCWNTWPESEAHKVADFLLKDKFNLKPETNKESEKIIEFTLEQLAGTYEVEPGKSIKLTVNNNCLHVTQSWCEDEGDIVRLNGNTFQPPDKVNYVFSDPKNGYAQKLTVDNAVVLNRINDIDISKIDINEFTGDYYSEELDTTYKIFNDNGILRVKVKFIDDPMAMFISDYDKFQSNVNFKITYKFNRNNCLITGFILDTFSVKGLQFQKIL